MSKKSSFEGLLLVSDMDGTLITETFDMPVRNIEAARAFMEGGGRFAFATGRTQSSAGAFLDRVRVNAPCILYNGAAIFDYASNRFLWSAALPESVTELVRSVIAHFPDFGVEALTDDVIYIVHESAATRRHTVNERLHYVTTDLEHVPKNAWRKMIFAGERERLDALMEFVAAEPNGGWDFVFSSTNFLEVLPRDVSKGSAVLRLASFLYIDRQHIFAIGDYYNDLTLLKTAAFGGVPAEAPQEIKEAADVVVGPCRQGAVADFIACIRTKVGCV